MSKDQNKQTSNSFWKQNKMHLIGIFLFACVLYANTINHDFAVDDAIVLYNNELVQKGFAGIPEILSTDSFYGFFGIEGKDLSLIHI